MAKLAIVGTGFAGTSLALALRPSKLFSQVVGYDVQRRRAQEAKRLGAIDEEARSPAAAVEQAAVVVVTVPGADLAGIFGDIAPRLAPGAIVTETSHWKQPAIQAARAELPAEVHFIGGRPILDTALHGPEAATAEVFRNAVYCLTPEPETSETAINGMSSVVVAAGSQTYFLDPGEHDALSAASELLPPALIASLAVALTGDSAWLDAGRLAGDTFSRYAAQAEELDAAFWTEAALNSAGLARWLDTAASSLLDLRDRLQSADAQQLMKDWQATTQALERWRRDKRRLQDSIMPSKSDMKPNLFGSMAALDRLRGKKQ